MFFKASGADDTQGELGMFSTIKTKIAAFDVSGVAIQRQAARLAAVSIGILGLAGCAVSPNGDERAASLTPEARREVVAGRVKARWDALIKGDVGASYAYLSPATRAAVSLSQYGGKIRKDGFREAKIDSIDCDADACKVKLWITYDHSSMKGITTPLQESWVFDKGQAWYVYRG